MWPYVIFGFPLKNYFHAVRVVCNVLRWCSHTKTAENFIVRFVQIERKGMMGGEKRGAPLQPPQLSFSCLGT